MFKVCLFLYLQTIDWVMKVEREFFYPNLAGYLGTSTQTVEEMQKKVDVFTPIYKVTWVVNSKNRKKETT